MFTIGADFAFQYANLSYGYIEELVKIVNEHPEGGRIFKFKYSTVQEYITAVQAEGKTKGIAWPEYNGDFLPITSNFPGHIWSGYFTSRPNFKQLIRQFSSVSQVSQTFYGLQMLDRLRTKTTPGSIRLKNLITELKKEAAKIIHHDTITGTSLIYIIYNETIELHQTFDKNAENL